jgi:hypothetical protein
LTDIDKAAAAAGLTVPGQAWPDDDVAIHQLVAHRHFPMALRHMLDSFLRLQDGYLINKLNADEGRHFVSIFALALHADFHADPSRSGLTLARLKRACAPLGVMGHGRIETTLGLLRQAGLLAGAPPGPDRRVRRLEPSEALVAQFRTRICFHLEALEMLFPDRGHLAQFKDDPAFFWRMSWLRAQTISTEPALQLRLPALAGAAQTEGGYVVLCALLRGLGDAPGLPQPGFVALPYAEHAERFGLSRTQMRRVVARLAAHGLARPVEPGGHTIEVLPLAIRTMAELAAIRLLRFDRHGLAAGVPSAPPASAPLIPSR